MPEHPLGFRLVANWSLVLLANFSFKLHEVFIFMKLTLKTDFCLVLVTKKEKSDYQMTPRNWFAPNDTQINRS